MRILVALTTIILFLLTACGRELENENSKNIAESNYYREQHRPQFHFSPKEKWMNDPNGMVFYEGEYHLFYQYYPDSTVWGPMHWGHAVSADMIHWEHLPIALYPDSLGYIFSGSAVVDWNNTSGFGQNGKPPLIAFFTHHLMEGEKAGRTDYQHQSIAYSNDNGRTWTKYEGNPVIPNTGKIKDFRDPKVIWHDASQQWIMVFAAYDHLKFWASKNLKNWEHLSDWGAEYGQRNGVWECPDLFPLYVEGTGEMKWVLLLSLNPGGSNGGSGTQYFIGNFDGKHFKLDERFTEFIQNGKGVWLDYGRDNYAGVTWSDIPKEDGRRIFLGWMSNWDYGQAVPTQTWRSAMTVPRQLVLKNTSDGVRLFTLPVEELKMLRKDSFSISSESINRPINLSEVFKADRPLLEVILEFEKSPEINFGVALSNPKNEEYQIGFDAKTNQFYSDRTNSGKKDFSAVFAAKKILAPRLSDGNTIKFHLFFDVASAELFADDGGTVMTEIFFPNEDYSNIRFFSNQADKFIKAQVFTLQPVWKK